MLHDPLAAVLDMVQGIERTLRLVVAGFPGEFSVRDLHAACTSASLDLVRKILKQMRKHRIVERLGRGRNARWRRIG